MPDSAMDLTLVKEMITGSREVPEVSDNFSTDFHQGERFCAAMGKRKTLDLPKDLNTVLLGKQKSDEQ